MPTAEGLWVVTSPMGAERDELWLLGGKPGVVRKRLVIPGTYDAHDAVCVGDAFWLVDTFHGRVLKLRTPDAGADELEVLRELPAWSRDEHINQVGVSGKPKTEGHALLVGVHARGTDAADRRTVAPVGRYLPYLAAVAAAGPGDLAADLAARYGGYDGFTNPARIKRG